jgi:hypothetical protein
VWRISPVDLGAASGKCCAIDALPEATRMTRPIARIRPRPASGWVTVERDEPGDLVCFAVRGRPSRHDLAAALATSLDLGLAERVLWTLERGDLSGLSLVELEAFAVEAFDGPWAPRRCALLGGAGPTMATAVWLAAFAEARGLSSEVEAFLDRDAALSWLGVSEAAGVESSIRPR